MTQEDTIDPITDEAGTRLQPPLTSCHLPFNEMGIVPPPDDRVMDVFNVTFDQELCKKREGTPKLS